jgi:hypothetical protein
MRVPSHKIRQLISSRPRDNKHPNYFDFWDPIIKSLEAFLGEGYKVTAYDPDIQVTVTYHIPDIDLYKQYSLQVPLEIAYRIAYLGMERKII